MRGLFQSMTLVAFAAQLAACSGSGALHGAAPAQPALSQASAGAAPPFNPKTDRARLRNATTPALPEAHLAPALARLASAAGRRMPRAWAGSADYEAAGVTIAPGGYYSAIYALQSAYSAAQMPIAYPAGSTDTSAIYESLTAPNGGCLGNFATWINAGSGTQAVFSVYDYCAASPAVVYQTPIDSAFLAKYTQPNSAGIPMYASEIYTFDLQPTATSQWASIIYNYQTGAYEQLAQSTGVLSSRTTGFALWTSELQPQACPVIPLMGADLVELYDNQRNRFELASPSMTDTTTHAQTPSAQAGCFNASGGGTSYQFAMLAPNRTFTVSASASAGYSTATFAPPFGAVSLAAGPNVGIWYSSGSGNHFGYIANGAITDYKGNNPDNGGGTIGPIASGPAGSVWFPYIPAHGFTTTGLNQSNTSGALTSYASSIQPFAVVAGSDGNMWTISGVGTTIAAQKYVPGNPSGSVTYPVPGTTPSDVAQAIALGPDGNLWFVIDNFVNQTARLYKMTPAGALTLVANASGSYNAITATQSAVYVSDGAGNRIVRFTPDGTQTAFPLPTPASNVGAIAAAGNGDVWFGEGATKRIGDLNPATGMITEYPVDPGPNGTSPVATAVDGSGNVWVATADRIIEYSFH